MRKLDEFAIADFNPYVGVLAKDITDNQGKKIVGSGTAELLDGNAVYRRTFNYKVTDRKEFVKVFRESIKTILKLSTTAQKVLWYIMDNLSINSNAVNINMSSCIQDCGFKTRKSVYDGITELLSKDIITRSSIAGRFWVNPLIVFNGDRIEFHNNYIMQE